MSDRQDCKNGVRAPPTPAPNTRSGRRRRATAGDLAALQREVWWCLRRVGEALEDPTLEVSELCKLAHALAGLANAYRGVAELGSIAERIEALERQRGVNA